MQESKISKNSKKTPLTTNTHSSITKTPKNIKDNVRKQQSTQSNMSRNIKDKVRKRHSRINFELCKLTSEDKITEVEAQ